ncbi:bifunctional methylenetetrahydrofolate dehydrogenase/cyclohydrolase 2, mitochondrial-like isoform X2 [Acipenser ruthenus]|uniref:bifunctional methylenetetrahydrofolate dehydrogenase/cyclohydrolase 2, mitochondrial-like isoform X2 n=1 Tax=Acipenser ruthenus TaxID=7906 RepID=UPI0027409E09|nr:bifunctional methylenetetrahydrofolate dehydrogenase/cyclohydrolase 2, mitochondrial-like isoform X2 [Acipenser ruthenus]
MAASVLVQSASFRVYSSLLQPCFLKKMRIFKKAVPHRHVCLSSNSYAATIISGTELAKQIHKEIQKDVEEWVSEGNKRPHLSVILVGDDPASRSYVRNKTKTAAALGISSETILRPSNVSQEELLEVIDRLNRDWNVSGLLVQLPLPEHFNERSVCNAVAPEKDVDGFHIVNVGKLCLDQKSMIPATPAAVWEIIKRTGDATVTIAHRFTPKEQLKVHTSLADIIIAAVGVPKLITADMVKEGAAVIDVGINRIQDPETGKTKLVGDVDFEEVKKKAGYITPVPGGVGPMTVAMLMKNTVTAARNLLTH